MRSRNLVLLSTVALLAACQSMPNHHRNSSVVDYLYPHSKDVSVADEVPRLELPLRIGVAFTPGGGTPELTESGKADLMADVSEHFEALDFVDRIEIIPTAYLRPGGSFENLEQLQRMFGIDVMVLLSYDQTRFTDEGVASLAYLTLIGAYVIPGEKNATHTLLDAAVYDIASRRMLFRAPGTSRIKSSATPVNLSEQVREDAVEGFAVASENLVKNLETEIGEFKQRIEAVPEDVHIARRDGYRGSGAGGWWLALIGLSLVTLRRPGG